MQAAIKYAESWSSAARRIVTRELDADDALLRRTLPVIAVLSAVSILSLTLLRLAQSPD